MPGDCEHVYYQYNVYVADRDRFVNQAIRRGVDVETLHMDVCARLPLFDEARSESPGADRAAQAIQLPAYASLSNRQVARVAKVAKAILRTAHVDHRPGH